MKQFPFIYILLAIAWTIPWKAVALWRAAKREEKKWFVVLLVINSLAVLEIIYIFFFSKRQQSLDKDTTIDKL